MSVIKILCASGIAIIGIAGIGIQKVLKIAASSEYKAKFAAYRKTATSINSTLLSRVSEHKHLKAEIADPDSEWWETKWSGLSFWEYDKLVGFKTSIWDTWEDFRDECLTRLGKYVGGNSLSGVDIYKFIESSPGDEYEEEGEAKNTERYL